MRAARDTARIVDLRGRAADEWRARMAAGHAIDHRVPAEMPGYFADRHAFGMLGPAWRVRRAPWPRLDPQALLERSARLRAALRPTQALDGWMADPDETVVLSGFYGDLLDRWSDFAAAVDLPTGLHRLTDARGGTWRDVFDDSVYYPRLPVLSGPNFLDELPAGQQRSILAEFGEAAPVDFFCFMQQVHETVHRHQTGEPVFNELIQAVLWSAFLDRNDLWVFQRDEQAARPLVRELAVVRNHAWLLPAAAEVGLDTALLVHERAPRDGYFVCCAWAQRFDRGALRYAEYLDGLDHVLAHLADGRWVRRASRTSLRRRPRLP